MISSSRGKPYEFPIRMNKTPESNKQEGEGEGERETERERERAG